MGASRSMSMSVSVVRTRSVSNVYLHQRVFVRVRCDQGSPQREAVDADVEAKFSGLLSAAGI